MKNDSVKDQKIIFAIEQFTEHAMSECELLMVMYGCDCWPKIRPRLLRVLNERGLKGVVTQILEERSGHE